METINLVVTGPVGAGKSTFIRSVSETEVFDTDRVTTDQTKDVKAKTTVAWDFGQLQFGPDILLHLYGTPGQVRFNFVWDTLIDRSHAYILLVAADKPSEFHNARLIYKFMHERAGLPMVLGITHLDCQGAWSVMNVAGLIGFKDNRNRPPVVALNATHPDSVLYALRVLVNQHRMDVRTKERIG